MVFEDDAMPLGEGRHTFRNPFVAEHRGRQQSGPYEFPAEASIPPWQWLYGRHLLRGEVAGTAAMGGTGKSTSSIVEALAMASGRMLLEAEVPRPLRVVLVNLEDTRNTMDKRIAAVMRHYGLAPADIGDRSTVSATLHPQPISRIGLKSRTSPCSTATTLGW